MNGKNMKKAGKNTSVKKLRTIPVVCLLISCLFGVVFVASEQASAADITSYAKSKFGYDSWDFSLPKVNTYAREYVINQAGALILPPINGMLIGGVIGFALGGLVGAAVGFGIGGTIGTAVSVAKNMVKFAKSVTDWNSLRSNIDLDSLRTNTDWSSFMRNINPDSLKSNIDPDSLKSNIDLDSLIRTNDEITMPLQGDTSIDWDSFGSTTTIITNPYADGDSISEFDTKNLHKFDPNVVSEFNTNNIPSFNPR
jgi:hypothetical protein